MVFDKTDKIGKSLVQYGPNNNRVYLVSLHPDDLDSIVDKIYNLTIFKRYTKIFAKVPEWALETFLEEDFNVEASIPGLYNGVDRGYFLGHFFSAKRSYVSRKERRLMDAIRATASEISDAAAFYVPEKYNIRKLETSDIRPLAKLYKCTFKSYPFPIFKESYLRDTMKGSSVYFGVFKGEDLIATSQAEVDTENSNALMTKFATCDQYRGKNLPYFLLHEMEQYLTSCDIKTAYTIIQATSRGLNKAFGRSHYHFGGVLINNSLVGKSIESMNVWYKKLK